MSVEWYTPGLVFDALGMRYDLDPCAPHGSMEAPSDDYCDSAYRAPDDGLLLPWSGRVWLNPPYDRSLSTWMDRMARHGDGIALVFARCSARWWQEAAAAATALCFVSGRLRFLSPADCVTWPRPEHGSGKGPMSSVLMAYGLECAEAVAQSGLGLTFGVQSPTLPDTTAMLWEGEAQC